MRACSNKNMEDDQGGLASTADNLKEVTGLASAVEVSDQEDEMEEYEMEEDEMEVDDMEEDDKEEDDKEVEDDKEDEVTS